MSGRKSLAADDAPADTDQSYIEKRKKNNEAVNRARAKKRKEETENGQRVEELRMENELLERKVESLQEQLKFLQEMFIETNAKKAGKHFIPQFPPSKGQHG